MITPKILDFIHENYHLKRIENFIRKNFNSNINIIFDVGCYKGSFIEICLKIYKSDFKIYAFEAEKKIYDRINNFKDNKNVNLYNCGISDQDNYLDFNVSYQEGTSTFSKLNNSSKYLSFKSKILGQKIFSEKQKIQVKKIDSFCKINKIEKIDFLKIDTEGHELSVLLGAKEMLKNIKVILLEVSEHDMYENYDNKKIDSLMIDNNFRLSKSFRTPFQKWEDRIYVNKKYY